MAAVAAAVGAKITSHGASGLERAWAAKVVVAAADVATRPAIAATARLCRAVLPGSLPCAGGPVTLPGIHRGSNEVQTHQRSS